ncbi:hypothetical protein ABWH98_06250 [Labrenzia sp. ac12]|uniref:hypothetical protein n=1 Tax=Labrenzia sp. THAF35 TaxID=2587854 RepID=UPI0012679E92|nr:hypothetical protein [Labrenzia sp. THAF35]QFT68642.1 hypothetical protein FIU93_17755 [Labrenzia sp. THAF35]
MRLPSCLIALGLSTVAVHAATFTVEGRRPAACAGYEEYAAFLDRKAAERVAAAGYERFIVHEGSTGNATRYNLIIEALPRGYSVSPAMRVMNVRAVLNSPQSCR